MLWCVIVTIMKGWCIEKEIKGGPKEQITINEEDRKPGKTKEIATHFSGVWG